MDNMKRLIDLIITTIDQDISKSQETKETKRKLIMSICALTEVDYSQFPEKREDIKSYAPSDDDPLSIAVKSNLESLERIESQSEGTDYSEFSIKVLHVIKKYLSDLPNLVKGNKIREKVVSDRIVDLKKARGTLTIPQDDESRILKETYEEYDEWFKDQFSEMEEIPNMSFNNVTAIPETIYEPFVKIDWYPGVKDTFAVTYTGKIYQWIKFKTCQVPTRPVRRGGERVINLTPSLKVFVSHLVWEAYHPEYRGKEYSLTYLDNNPNNLKLDNLILKTGSELELK